MISQSGNVALEIGEFLAAYDLGISRFASLGNQADLDATDLLQSFAAHERTRLIGVYVEDFRDGRGFARAARAAVAAGKPVVLMTAGRSPAGARTARSHTGALVSDARAVEAACRAAGIVPAATPKDLADAAQALLAQHALRGPRIGVIGDGGGHNAIAADAVSAVGFELPALSERLAGDIAAMLPAHASTANPVDFAGVGEQDVRTYPRVARALLASGEVDAVVLTGYFGGYGGEAERLAARELAGIAEEARMPLVVHTMYGDSAPAKELRAGGVPATGRSRPPRARSWRCEPVPCGRRRRSRRSRTRCRGRSPPAIGCARARGLRGDPARAGSPRPDGERGARGGRRAGFSGRAQGDRRTAQIRRRRGRRRHSRRRAPPPCARRPVGGPRARRAVGRADGPGARRGRADRGHAPGRPLRPHRARRSRRRLRQDLQGGRRRARARSTPTVRTGCSSRSVAPLCSRARAGGHGSTSRPRPRRPRRCHGSARRVATSTSSRSIRSWSRRPARWPSTPAWFPDMLEARS